MLCAQCGSDNFGEAKFCDQCSAPLLTQCPRCAAPNRPNAKFCGTCAAPLQAAAAPAKPAVHTPENQHVDGERRHLSVLFCDIAGSTALSSHLDPEEFREIVTRYHTAARQAVVRFGGEVAHYLGDGLLVYFGYPQAHEDDAYRAVMAGLEILENLTELNRDLASEHRPTLAVRVGIHTGSVVVGEGSGREADVYGDVPNVTSRVQNAAAPGSVLITAAVHQLVAGLFVLEDQGEQALKGIEQPFRLYRVNARSGARDRLAAAAGCGLTPFIGREDELRLLLNRWEQARGGEGQVIVVVGEPGIGKSRLLQRFHQEIAGSSHTWIDCAALALHQNTPFFAITEMLQDCVRLRAGQAGGDRIGALEALLTAAGLKLAEAMPLIAPLLDLDISAKYPPLNLTPEQQRKRLLGTIAFWALGTARVQPLIVAVEDLHWADPSTLEAIHLIGEQCHSAPLMLICTARPEFRAPWPLRAYHAVVTLNRLSARNAREMVARVASAAALQPATIDALVERSGGVPLYVEELTRTIVESGGVEFQAGEIPATLHDSLMARLDRLGAAREIAQVAAVIGHEFSWPLLSAVTGMDDEKLETGVAKLSDAEVIFASGMPPDANYKFKHALLHDVAYESLLKVKRQHYHQRVPEVLQQQFPEIAEARPELLAYHYTQADLREKAIAQWQAAGQKAAQRWANAEAVTHFKRALELLKSEGEGPQKWQQELALQIARGNSLIAIKGFGSPEVGTAYERARELCGRMGEVPQLFPVLWGLWVFYTARALHEKANELAGKCLHLADTVGDQDLLMEGHHAMGVTLLALGEFAPALEHLRQAIAIYHPDRHGSMVFVYGQDSSIVCRSHAAWALWFLGDTDQALKMNQEALELAEKLSHPSSLAAALNFSAWLHQLCNDREATLKYAERAIAVSTEHEYAFWIPMGTILHGWAVAEGGQLTEGVAEIRRGLDAFRATGAEIMRPYYLGLLAEGYGKLDQAAEGLRALAEAMEAVKNTNERWWEAELYRLKGELTLLQSDDPKHKDAAEGYFKRAVDIARGKAVKPLELRSAISMRRLLAEKQNPRRRIGTI